MEPNVRHRHGHGHAPDDGAGVNEEVRRNGNLEELDLDDFDLVIEYFGPQDAENQNGTPWEDYHRCLGLFILYLFYEVEVFLVLFFSGFFTHEFCNFLARTEIPLFGLFSYIGSYYCVLHLCILFKLLLDFFEQQFDRIPGINILYIYYIGFEILYEVMPNFKCVYSWISLGMVGICYWALFTQFHEKCKLLTLGDELYQANWSIYVVCLCYIYYFNVVSSINGSERATAFHQIMQNGLNILFGTMILRFGQLCGMLLLLEEIDIKSTTIVSVLVTIFLTLVYVGFQKVLFDKVNMGSGTKWGELLWSCLATDFLLKSYFGMQKSENIESHTIQFQTGASYLLCLTTKLVVEDFGKVYLAR